MTGEGVLDARLRVNLEGEFGAQVFGQVARVGTLQGTVVVLVIVTIIHEQKMC